MLGMEEFHTRGKANEGRKLPLHAPDGSPTDHWLQVRHVWSDAFQQAEEAGLRATQETMMGLGDKPDPVAVAALKREATGRLLASLVSGWSFDMECTPESVAAFLHDAPQIAEQINRFAADSRGFFGNESRRSRRGSKAKSA